MPIGEDKPQAAWTYPLAVFRDIGKILASALRSHATHAALVLIVLLVAVVTVTVVLRVTDPAFYFVNFVVFAMSGVGTLYLLARPTGPHPPSVEKEAQKQGVTPVEAASVMAALESRRFEWRTAQGIAEETGLPLTRVRRIIRTLEDYIMRSPVKDANGKQLYTSSSYYEERRKEKGRLLSALS